MTIEYHMLRAERLVLLIDAHRARQRHKATKAIQDKLKRVTAQIAAMEAGNELARHNYTTLAR